MFQNTTVSSRSSSSRSGGGGGNSCGRNSSMPSLRMRSPLSPKTSFNPLFRHSDAPLFTSFDASHFVFHEEDEQQQQQPQQQKTKRHERYASKRAILRRYNSHDSHANFADVIANGSRSECKSDTHDSATTTTSQSRSTPRTNSPDSTGGKRKSHELEARDFLERYSLPRVVRVANGEPQLLYRCFDSFTKVQARVVTGKKGKEKHDAHVLHFPEGYSGWFTLMNEKGERSAILYTSMLQLVREQVCSFINIQPFTAYAGHNGTELTDASGKVQYLKTQVRGGQLFQLRAVFQHRERADGRHSTKSKSGDARPTRDKDLANRYAQLISQNNQELYVPLTTKGEFYETHSSMKAKLCFPGLLDKTGPLALDKDCLYRVTHLLRRVALPIKVKLMAGPLPPGLPKDFSDTFILEKKFQEPLMVTCTLPSPSSDSQQQPQHRINCINLNSNVKLSKCMLGFESESRLFKSQRLQAALAYCHKNVESWYREVRLAPNLEQQQSPSKTGSNRYQSGDEIRKSIEKFDDDIDDDGTPLDNELNNAGNKQLITKEVIDKFHKPKKWYKHFKLLGGGGNNVNSNESSPVKQTEAIDGSDKVRSIDRYKDMSKLIEEKFGKKSYNPVKKSASFMFSSKRIDLDESRSNNHRSDGVVLSKCQSLDAQIYSTDDHRVEPCDNGDATTAAEERLDVARGKAIKVAQSLRETKPMNFRIITDIDLEEIRSSTDEPRIVINNQLKKSKPDLIPTLTKDNSFISDRLCAEFHVKTKLQKRGVKDESQEIKGNTNKTSIVVQVHEVVSQKSKQQQQQKTQLVVDDIPYSQVIDEITEKVTAAPQRKQSTDENIYAEICETACNCCAIGKSCDCKKRTTKRSDYCYVKLGSNGESITSDSDEAIYNTLR